jgi:hypothetical protein
LLQASTDRLGGLSCPIGPLLYGLLYGLGRSLDRGHCRLGRFGRFLNRLGRLSRFLNRFGGLLGRRCLLLYGCGLLFYSSRLIGDWLGCLVLRRRRGLGCWLLLRLGGLLLNGGRHVAHRLGTLGLGFSAEEQGNAEDSYQCAHKN